MLIILLAVFMAGILVGLLLIFLIMGGKAREEVKEWAGLGEYVIRVADGYHQTPLPKNIKKFSRTPR
jgi:hypothetical protein